MSDLASILNEVRRLREAVETLPGRINVSAAQVVVVTCLSDITEKLGLIQAGEFRVGNRLSPGDGFTGLRIAYPPLSYGGNLYNLAGVDADTVTVALNSSDGTLITGDTEVTMSSDGLVFLESTLSRFRFIDGSGLRSGDITKAAAGEMSIRSDTDLRFEVGVDIGTGGSTGAALEFVTYDTGYDAGPRRMFFNRHPNDPNIPRLIIQTGGEIVVGGDTDATQSQVTLRGDTATEVYARLSESPNLLTIGSSDNLAAYMYVLGDKLVFATWDNAGSQARYLSINLQSGSTDWAASTNQPTTST